MLSAERIKLFLWQRGVLGERFRWRGGSLPGLLVAVAVVGAALALRLALSPWLAGVQFITFFPAVIVAALLGGTIPGLVAVLLSAAASILVPAPGQSAAQAGYAMLLFSLVATMDVAIMSAMLWANTAMKGSVARIGELNANLRASEARFRDLIETAPDALVIADREERVVLVNTEAERMFGYTREELLGQPIAILMPEDFRAGHQGRIAAFLASPCVRRMGYGRDLFALRRDGTHFPIETNLSLLPGSAGGLISSAIRDISARREGEERQALLIRELNHRVKNTLASVQAIVHQTLKTASGPEAFSEALMARLSAFSQSHDVLTRNDWAGAQVRDIAAEQLSPYGRRGEERFHLRGPDVTLSPNRAVTLGMVLGELATNAAKYGALSNGGGVEVAWTRRDEAGVPRLALIWRERGGPEVREPTTRGFGTRLIERSVAAGLGGTATLVFEPEGVTCSIDFPLLANEA